MQNTLAQPQARNCSIDLWRFVGATTAVAVHTFFLSDISPALYNYTFHGLLSRYVVQFFICISGYYFFNALLEGRSPFKKQFFHILKIYVVWTIIYYSASFVQSVLINKVPLSKFLIDRVVFFFTEGSYPHFWNLTAILYSMLIAMLVYKLFHEKGLFVLAIFSIFLFCIGAFGSPYYTFSQHLPIFSQLYSWSGFFVFRSIFLIGLPCFSLGYLLAHWQAIYKTWSSRKVLVLLGIASALYTAESVLMILLLDGIDRPHSQFMTYPFLAILLITLLHFPMTNLAKTAELSRLLANFIYFVHPLLIIGVTLGFGFIGISIGGTVLFFIVQAVAMLMGYILIKINTPWSNTLLGLPSKRLPRKKIVKCEDVLGEN